MTPSDKILRKALIASGIDSSRWEHIRAELRDRAFFSSRIESIRYLAEARAEVAKLLSEAKTDRGTITTREDAIRAIRERARSEGLQKTGTSPLTDPASRARASVIVDTNAGLAAGYVRHERNMSPGSRIAFPCQEFIRVRESRSPRQDWPRRWLAAGGEIRGGRMVATMESPVWTNLSRFGCPYPPFDYNSGMGVRMVSRAEAIELGAIDADYRPALAPRQPGFNDGLSSEIDIGHWSKMEFRDLQDSFGSQVRFVQDGQGTMKAQWTALDIPAAFRSNKGNGIIAKLGSTTEQLLDKIPHPMRENFQGKGCTITHDLRAHMAKDGHWPEERNLRSNAQLSEGDFELLPSIWRSPDRAIQGKSDKDIILELDCLDGDTLRLVVNGNSGGATPQTFYKKRNAGKKRNRARS